MHFNLAPLVRFGIGNAIGLLIAAAVAAAVSWLWQRRPLLPFPTWLALTLSVTALAVALVALNKRNKP
jgi:hypothetical protein